MSSADAAQAQFLEDDFFTARLAESDPALAEAIRGELRRQQDQIELIASENIVSRAVLDAQGSILTNKYAEGYPGRRYYGGCEYVDDVESLAIDRAKQLFGSEFVNVQPHSGAQANQCVTLALLKPGDTILGLSLAAGGHLTHGAKPNLSGKWFNAVQYGVKKEDGLIDFDEVESLAREHKPKLIIAGGSAYPRILDFPRFRQIADEVGAYFQVDMAHFAGLVAAGVHPEPDPACPRCDHDDAQDAARRPWRHDPHERPGSRQEDQLGGLPRSAGRPADARHRLQGRRLRRGAQAELQGLFPDRRGERADPGGDPGRAGLRHRLRRHRHPPHAGRPAAQGPGPATSPRRASIAPASPATRTACPSIRRSRR